MFFSDECDSPGWAFLRILFLGGMWYGAYQKGRQDTIREVETIAMQLDIEDLRRKLAEQNRVNERNRLSV